MKSRIRSAVVVAAALLLPGSVHAQWSRVYEQFYYPAPHNWEFRERYRIADRLFNAFDYGHAILYETLYTQPNAPTSKLEVEEYDFITRKLLPKPPRIPLEEAAIEVAYAKIAPEAKAMFEWAHVLHRQIYDILADESLSQEEKDASVAAVVRYYKSRPEYAFSSHPKTMELMEGQFYSTAFRKNYPKFNGLIWGYHWLQVGLYEPLMVGRNYSERQTGIAATVARFFQMIERAPENMPRLMPMTAAVAPTFAARYPEASIIFDNLHSLHDVISDILASPEVPRDKKRSEILRAAARYRDDTSFVMTREAWLQMAAHMGLENMGGPPVGFLPQFAPGTVERGAVMAGMEMSAPGSAAMPGMPGMQHGAPTAAAAGSSSAAHADHANASAAAPAPASGGMGGMNHSAGAASDSAQAMHSQIMKIHERMMADPVIKERVSSDPVLQRMMSDMHATGGMHDGGMAAPSSDAQGRTVMEFVTRLLSDPAVEARIHSVPQAHQLWSDPAVQQCIKAMKALKASGKPLPAICPASTPVAPVHKHDEERP